MTDILIGGDQSEFCFVFILCPLSDQPLSSFFPQFFRTCFYVLGLIGSTSLGAEKLESLGWDSVRHKCSEDWPVMEPDIGYFYEEMSDEEEVWNLFK